jgi:uncharacterized protein (TIRG00374 family)
MLIKWQFRLGDVISAIFLFIALRGMHLADLWQTVVSANYFWIIPGVVVYFLAVWARVWRWHYLLRSIKYIPLKAMWPPVVIGYMGNNVYPFRAGEVIRAYVLKRNEGVSVSASLATILVERIFDGLVMLIFVLISLPTVPNLPVFLKQTVILGSAAFLGALLVLSAWAILPTRMQAIYGPLIDRFLPEHFRERARDMADNFTHGLSSLRNMRDVLMVFVTSFVIWLLETVKYWFVMHAFAFTVSFFTLMLMNGVVNLATTLPSAPGYIGTFDGPGIEVLKIFGVDPAVAAAYTLVLHAALWLPITLLGFWYMGKESLSWREFKQAAQETEPPAVAPASPQPAPDHYYRES